MISSKDYQQKEYNFDNYISDFQINYRNRARSLTKVAPFKFIMNLEDEDLINKI